MPGRWFDRPLEAADGRMRDGRIVHEVSDPKVQVLDLPGHASRASTG
ncbi:MAG: hypothetical protein QOE21_250 [Microbacteriaceae bacterium]|nr:hypothetical protein [Microbacteriaceae bacterium]